MYLRSVVVHTTRTEFLFQYGFFSVVYLGTESNACK